MVRKSKKLTSKAVRALLDTGVCSPNKVLTDKLQGYTVYVLSDGSCLVDFGKGQGGRLFKSREDLITLAFPPEASPFDRMLISGRRFVEEAASHANTLGELLGIAPEQMDFSASSLRLVDNAINKRRSRAKFYEARFFTPLLAYVGEVFRRFYGGRWEIHSLDDKGDWEPWIRLEDGTCIRPQGEVLKELEEDGGPMIADRIQTFYPEMFAE